MMNEFDAKIFSENSTLLLTETAKCLEDIEANPNNVQVLYKCAQYLMELKTQSEKLEISEYKDVVSIMLIICQKTPSMGEAHLIPIINAVLLDAVELLLIFTKEIENKESNSQENTENNFFDVSTFLGRLDWLHRKLEQSEPEEEETEVVDKKVVNSKKPQDSKKNTKNELKKELKALLNRK